MNNALVAVLVLVLIALVGWFAYSQGFLQGAEKEQKDGVEIQIGGSSDESS